MSQTTPPSSRRAHRPPRINIKNLQSNNGSALGSMPPTAQPPFTAQTMNTQGAGSTMGAPGIGAAGQPYWPQYAGNFMVKGFEDFVDFTKSGMSFGEKFTYGLYNKFSKWSKNWFTHIFLTIVVILYTVGGALMFQAVETSKDGQTQSEAKMDRKKFFNDVRALAKDDFVQSNNALFDGQIIYLLREHSQIVTSMLNSNKTMEEMDQTENPWDFMSAVFFCGTIYTTIGLMDQTKSPPTLVIGVQ